MPAFPSATLHCKFTVIFANKKAFPHGEGFGEAASFVKERPTPAIPHFPFKNL